MYPLWPGNELTQRGNDQQCNPSVTCFANILDLAQQSQIRFDIFLFSFLDLTFNGCSPKTNVMLPWLSLKYIQEIWPPQSSRKYCRIYFQQGTRFAHQRRENKCLGFYCSLLWLLQPSALSFPFPESDSPESVTSGVHRRRQWARGARGWKFSREPTDLPRMEGTHLMEEGMEGENVSMKEGDSCTKETDSCLKEDDTFEDTCNTTSSFSPAVSRRITIQGVRGIRALEEWCRRAVEVRAVQTDIFLTFQKSQIINMIINTTRGRIATPKNSQNLSPKWISIPKYVNLCTFYTKISQSFYLRAFVVKSTRVAELGKPILIMPGFWEFEEWNH